MEIDELLNDLLFLGEDEEPTFPKPTQKYVYMVDRDKKVRESLPDFVFPTFRDLLDMIELLRISGEEARPGRILIESYFFVVRQPYLKRFMDRQELSLKLLTSVFEEHPEYRPTHSFSDEQIQDFENTMFAGWT
ncbi:MAG: hypothetical protein U1D69_13320 [Polynucleobacter sp.]|nr:hypothetical protein [Polynucleobacter sp.]